MGICDYYDSLAEEALGIGFNEIVASEAHRDWCAGYEFSEYVESSYFLTRDFLRAFESIAGYLQEGDLWQRCIETADIDADTFLGGIIAKGKPLEILAYYNRLCELNRERGYYNDEIDHLRSLPVLEHFIIVCEMEALKWWQIEIEYAHEWLLETE